MYDIFGRHHHSGFKLRFLEICSLYGNIVKLAPPSLSFFLAILSHRCAGNDPTYYSLPFGIGTGLQITSKIDFFRHCPEKK